MRWEEWLLDQLDDLERQAEGLYLADRDAQVADQSAGYYAELRWAQRLLGSAGTGLRLTLSGGHVVEGVVRRVGMGWLLLDSDSVVNTSAVLRARGLSERAVATSAIPSQARLGLGAVLRQLAAAQEPVVVGLLDGAVLSVGVRRVGADFVELLAEGTPAPEAVPFAALAVVRRQVAG